MRQIKVTHVLMCILYFGCNITLAEPSNEQQIIDGQALYVQCTGCHSPDYHRTGPKHCGVVGRLAGSDADYEFSSAMRESNIIWSTETLDQFLKAPLTMVPGTSMGFFGISSDKDRTSLIAYLASLTSKHSKCL